MTTDLGHTALLGAFRPAALTRQIADDVAGDAAALDHGERDTRAGVTRLAQAGLIGLGAPDNHDGALPAMAATIAQLAGKCLSTAFSVWAHRMTLEYLTAANTPWAQSAAVDLHNGDALGVTGMASAFKDAAGCGSLDLAATPVDGGHRLSGTLRWASNLYPDSVMVTAARLDSGEKIVVTLPLAAPGVTIGDHFDLLALGSTASSTVALNDVYISDGQVLSRDIGSFLTRVRPTFLVLQSALCVGLARRCLDEAAAGLSGVNSVFATEIEALTSELINTESKVAAFAESVGGPATPGKRDLLEVRLAAAELVSAAHRRQSPIPGGRIHPRAITIRRPVALGTQQLHLN